MVTPDHPELLLTYAAPGVLIPLPAFCLGPRGQEAFRQKD